MTQFSLIFGVSVSNAIKVLWLGVVRRQNQVSSFIAFPEESGRHRFMGTRKEHQITWTFAMVSDWGGFTMVINEKIYLEAFINKQYAKLKNNTAQLEFILGRAIYVQISQDASDIHRFPTVHMIKINLLLEKL